MSRCPSQDWDRYAADQEAACDAAIAWEGQVLDAALATIEPVTGDLCREERRLLAEGFSERDVQDDTETDANRILDTLRALGTCIDGKAVLVRLMKAIDSERTRLADGERQEAKRLSGD